MDDRIVKYYLLCSLLSPKRHMLNQVKSQLFTANETNRYMIMQNDTYRAKEYVIGGGDESESNHIGSDETETNHIGSDESETNQIGNDEKQSEPIKGINHKNNMLKCTVGGGIDKRISYHR